MQQGTHDSRASKLALGIGYGSLLVGVHAAFTSPATGYELSVYGGTPTAFWVGVAVAAVAGVAVAVARVDGGWLRDGGLALVSTAVLGVVGLPLIRGYYQFGGGDSLTHLGWTRDIAAGRLDPVGFLYPGIHTTTIYVARALGIRFGRAQLVVTLAFVVVFVAFVALCVRLLDGGRWGVPVGVVAGLLVLPNNNVSVHLLAHPVTQSLLVLPLVLYLVVRYAVPSGVGPIEDSRALPAGALLSLVAVAAILVHPQGGLNVIAVLASILLAQTVARRYDLGDVANHRSLTGPTVVAVVAFALWAPRHERVRSMTGAVFGGLLGGEPPGDEIAQRSASLDVLGGSVMSLGAKLFLVSAVFAALAAAVAVAWYRGSLGDRFGDRNGALLYVMAALAPLAAAFLVFFAASTTTQHFRYVGFLLVPVTVLGALGLVEAVRRFGRSGGDVATKVAVAVCLLALLPLPIATIHASPFVYQPSQDVTEQQLRGVEETVAVADRDVPLVGVRSGPWRAVDATYGTVGARDLGLRGRAPSYGLSGPVFATNLSTHYDSPRYVPVTRADRVREVRLYEGFRYPRAGFEGLETTRGVDRVYTNGEYRLYLVDGRSTDGR